ncbi:MAG TPA: hypothetical protein VM580_33735 [Labilithrix sp.]|jgi:hypothetical protein|nr:hypothetical protein [Labilithrix sp.]
MNKVDVLQIGQHSMWFDPETKFHHIIHVGVMNGVEMKTVADWTADTQRKYHPDEPPFQLVDNRSSTGFTSDARPALANHPLARTEVYAAMFGASLVVRTFINLIYRGLALATRSKSITKAFVTEADARTWLSEQQGVIRRRRAGSVA